MTSINHMVGVSIPGYSSLHAKVYLGKMMNLELLLNFR